MSTYSGFGPRCPNHHVPLQKTNTPKIGICPISGYRFAYEADDAEQDKKLAVGLDGKMHEVNSYKMTSLDGDGG